jgi:hypothetical protein
VHRLPDLDELTLRAIWTNDPVEAEMLKDAARQSDQLTEASRIRPSGARNPYVEFPACASKPGSTWSSGQAGPFGAPMAAS